MPRMHQARLRFRPSRWTSCGSVRSVTVAGSKSDLGSPRGGPGQEPREPGAELGRRAGRDASGRPPSGSARRSPAPPAPTSPGRRRPRRSRPCARSSTSALQPRVADRPGVVVGERQAEGGVRVDAGPDRVGLLREELQVAGDDHVRQRPEVLRPVPGVGVVPAVQLLGELEQPGPAVGPLERLALLAARSSRPRP